MNIQMRKQFDKIILKERR